AVTRPAKRVLAVALRVGDRVLDVRAGELRRTLRAERFAPLPYQGSLHYDLTGDGVEDLVLSAWSGRRARLWLLRGGKRPSLTRLPGWHGPYTRLADLDGDGRPELETHDDSFRGWRGVSQADSPAPRVVLRLTQEGWRLAPTLLEATPTKAELKSRAKGVRAAFGERAPVALWATLLELEARGEAALAKAFLAQAWPSDRPGRTEFWVAYQSRAARGLLRLLPR
ncbi:MAG: VCBS repeat-containing protein, partial [Planctomycetes bacterium]|nr:VCBS repeat-containing protein [Planctomycetota bacterium]